MSEIKLMGITKKFGNVIACDVDELEIKDGEVVSFLGPSGCGKTTTLRIIAGLEEQDTGDLYIGGKLMNNIPPEKRNTAMVFQSYALFPHMTVFDNIAFGLKIRKFSKEEIKEKVAKVLELVKLPNLEERYPSQLSGGQQQRISLARAVVVDPDVLLFDEPLSNLDAKLREYMRFELRTFLKKLKITSVYVTHDQAEALVVSDKIVIMNEGTIEQNDTPHVVYAKPKTRFVADFMGSTTFIESVLKEKKGDYYKVVDKDGLPFICLGDEDFSLEDKVLFCIRPENIELFPFDSQLGGDNLFDGLVDSVVDLGEFLDYEVWVGSHRLRTKTFSRKNVFRRDDRVKILLDPSKSFIVRQ